MISVKRTCSRFRLIAMLFLIGLTFSAINISGTNAAIMNESDSDESSEDSESIDEQHDEPYLDDYIDVLNHKADTEEISVGSSVLCKFERGNPGKKLIALTFDDGPHQDYTPQILRILKEHDVKATFFVVGLMAKRYPYLVRAEYLGGHEIGNHTHTHENLTQMSDSGVVHEITMCGDAIEHVTNIKPKLFRPSGGNHTNKITGIANSLGYTVVLWSVDPGDYLMPSGTEIINRIMRKVKNGGVILLHDGVQQTIDALPEIITRLKNKGYEFVTVSEMMENSISRK